MISTNTMMFSLGLYMIMFLFEFSYIFSSQASIKLSFLIYLLNYLIIQQ